MSPAKGQKDNCWVLGLLLVLFLTPTLPSPESHLLFTFISAREPETRQAPPQGLAFPVLHLQLCRSCYKPLRSVPSHQPRELSPSQYVRGTHRNVMTAELRGSYDCHVHVMCFPVLQLFVGLGFPYEGPAPLEAIANGCAFLNPKFNPPKSSKNTDFFIGKPTLREVSIRSVPLSCMLLCLCVCGWVARVCACAHAGMHMCAGMFVEATG